MPTAEDHIRKSNIHTLANGLDAMEEAQKQGRGAVTLDGKLIDIASIKQARVLVDTAAQIGVR